MNKKSSPGSSAESDKSTKVLPQDSPLSKVEKEVPDVGNIDKIRDILFGNQAKDYERRFARMESQLVRESGELKREMLKHIDALETYIKQEIKDINERIKKESNERITSQKNIEKELKENFEALNLKILQEQENLSEKATELRDRILEQSKQLSAEIQSKSDAAANNLKQAVNELDNTKVNRSDLSGFFLEFAMRLSGDDVTGSADNT